MRQHITAPSGRRSNPNDDLKRVESDYLRMDLQNSNDTTSAAIVADSKHPSVTTGNPIDVSSEVRSGGPLLSNQSRQEGGIVDNPLTKILNRAQTALQSLQSIRSASNHSHSGTDSISASMHDYLRSGAVSRDGLSLKPRSILLPSVAPKPLTKQLSSDILKAVREGSEADSTRTIFDCYDSQINLLLGGVDAAFDDCPEVDDETVRHLLLEGGSPPSQVVFPTLYGTSQKLLFKLQQAKYLRVSCSRISISSVRFAVRRKGSCLRVLPPRGVVFDANHSNTLMDMLTLNELELGTTHRVVKSTFDPLFKLKSKSALLAERYFSGDADLQKSITFAIRLDDATVKAWLQSDGLDGCIKIELLSSLSPVQVPAPTFGGVGKRTRTQRLAADLIVFGYVSIPLRGLLCSDDLDAIATCQLIADPTTLSSVLVREQALPNGRSMSTRGGTPLGSVLGTLTARITVLGENAASDPTELIRKPLESLLERADGDVLLSGQGGQGTTTTPTPPTTVKSGDQIDVIHNALNFVPEDIRINKSEFSKPSISILRSDPPVRHLEHEEKRALLVEEGTVRPTTTTTAANEEQSRSDDVDGVEDNNRFLSVVLLAVLGKSPASIPLDSPFSVTLSYKVTLRYV